MEHIGIDNLGGGSELLRDLKEKLSRCKLIIDGKIDAVTFAQEVKNGRTPQALCINIENQEIYIGSDHYGMYVKHDIPVDAYLAGNYHFEPSQNRIIVTDLIDWRPKSNDEIKDQGTKDTLAAQLQKLLFTKEDTKK